MLRWGSITYWWFPIAALDVLWSRSELQLEGTSIYYLVQLPDCFRADKKLKNVIEGIVQMTLKL